MLVNNNISSYFMGDDSPHISISGNVGFPNYWHNYVTFELQISFLLFNTLMVIYMIYPLNGVFHEFAIVTMVIYGLFALSEHVMYQWTGSGLLGESMYYYLIISYTAALLIAAIRLKVWIL